MIKWVMAYPAYVKKLRKFWLEIVLISLALMIAAVSAFLYFSEFGQTPPTPNTDQKPAKIYVDISGAVVNPGLYEALDTDRFKNIIEKAGGLTKDADKDFFAINYNLASRVVDEQKIYVPTVWEVNNGYLIEKAVQTNQPSSTGNGDSSLETISVNEATPEELETLPGVGKITARKIIDNRPYEALQELIDKKVLGKTVFENIKILIGI